ncbi:putative cell lysis protein [Zalerion maritima]|uniref:Reticulon-like protein n=1 Tax=Zalerion maritima TaxID=339359 RepID=A0AAD5RT00_9PEZI|nr:putative cell lysis protein [Zalerion maritima]
MAEPATTNGNTAPSTMDSVKNGPLAQSVKDQTSKTTGELSNLAATRKTPSNPAATGQPLTHYHSFFSSLLAWDNPRASAIAYASVVSFIFAVRYLDLIRYGLKLTWITLLATVTAEVLGKAIMGTGLATSFRPRKYITVSEETLNSMIGDVHELVNFFMIEAQRIAFVENVLASSAAFVAAFLSYYLVKIVPYWGLALIGVTTAFFVPLVYTSNQELIDGQLKHAGEILDAQTRQMREVAGKHTAHATEVSKQYLGDYTTKAQAMLRGRSASPEALSKPAKKEYQDTDFPAPPKDEPAKEESAVPGEKKEEEEPLLS